MSSVTHESVNVVSFVIGLDTQPDPDRLQVTVAEFVDALPCPAPPHEVPSGAVTVHEVTLAIFQYTVVVAFLATRFGLSVRCPESEPEDCAVGCGIRHTGEPAEQNCGAVQVVFVTV